MQGTLGDELVGQLVAARADLAALLGTPIGDAPSLGLGDPAAREALAVVTSSYEHHGGFRLRTLA